MRLKALIFGLAIFAADLVSKWWVDNTPRFAKPYPLIEGFFSIHCVHNEGIAFGLFHSVESSWKPVILSLLAIVATVVVLYYIAVTPGAERWTLVALGLLLGGILGNFVDRLLHGHVIDFLELHWEEKFMWPTFNVADTAITCGVLMIVADSLFRREPRSEGDEARTADDRP
jgi:signal peptidase II